MRIQFQVAVLGEGKEKELIKKRSIISCRHKNQVRLLTRKRVS